MRFISVENFENVQKNVVLQLRKCYKSTGKSVNIYCKWLLVWIKKKDVNFVYLLISRTTINKWRFVYPN